MQLCRGSSGGGRVNGVWDINTHTRWGREDFISIQLIDVHNMMSTSPPFRGENTSSVILAPHHRTCTRDTQSEEVVEGATDGLGTEKKNSSSGDLGVKAQLVCRSGRRRGVDAVNCSKMSFVWKATFTIWFQECRIKEDWIGPLKSKEKCSPSNLVHQASPES